jgi:hypothetical protein
LRQGVSNAAEAKVAILEFRRQVQKLRRLRGETAALRQVMTESLRLLLANLQHKPYGNEFSNVVEW